MNKTKTIGMAIFAIATLAVALPAASAAIPQAFARSTSAANTSSADIGGCALFPANSIFNARVDTLPVHPNSAAFVNSIGANTSLHPTLAPFMKTRPSAFPTSPCQMRNRRSISLRYNTESDPGPYPIPADAPIEGGSASNGDRHILMVQTPSCKLYEVFASYPPDGASNSAWCVSGSWCAGSGAVWDLRSNALRPDTWTSADAAGLPILPLLVRYDEAAIVGEIRHPIRFTADITRDAYVWPARHSASDNTSANVPPLGMRFSAQSLGECGGDEYLAGSQAGDFRAMKTYGMLLADNGSNWYVSGAHDLRWNDENLVDAFNLLHGRDFEAVDSSSLMVSVNSGEVRTISPRRVLHLHQPQRLRRRPRPPEQSSPTPTPTISTFLPPATGPICRW